MSTTTPSKPLMCVRIDATLKQELERAARADERSLSSLVAKVLRDWVQAHAKRGTSQPNIRTALLAATVLALAAMAAQAQPYQRPPMPYTQPVPWVPKAYPPMSQPWMRIDPSVPLMTQPVAPYQRPVPYRIQPPASP